MSGWTIGYFNIIPTMPIDRTRLGVLGWISLHLFEHCTCAIVAETSLDGKDMVGLGLVHVRLIT